MGSSERPALEVQQGEGVSSARAWVTDPVGDPPVGWSVGGWMPFE